MPYLLILKKLAPFIIIGLICTGIYFKGYNDANEELISYKAKQEERNRQLEEQSVAFKQKTEQNFAAYAAILSNEAITYEKQDKTLLAANLNAINGMHKRDNCAKQRTKDELTNSPEGISSTAEGTFLSRGTLEGIAKRQQIADDLISIAATCQKDLIKFQQVLSEVQVCSVPLELQE